MKYSKIFQKQEKQFLLEKNAQLLRVKVLVLFLKYRQPKKINYLCWLARKICFMRKIWQF